MTSGPGYGPSSTVLVANVLATIPDPSSQTPTGGAMPPSLRYVVLTNSSPFTLLVAHGGVLGELAAFTQDVFDLGPYTPWRTGDAVPITVLPQVPSGTVGVADSHVYAVWYEEDPGGTYPAALGAGEITIVANTTLAAQVAIPNAVGTYILPGGGQFYPVAPSFAGVVVDIPANGGNVLGVTFNWADENGNGVGQEVFLIGPFGRATAMRPALGAQLSVTVQVIVAGLLPASFTLHGMASPWNSWMLNDEGALLDSGVQPVANGVTASVGFSTLTFAGPVTHLLTGSPPFTWRFDVMDNTGTFINKFNLQATDLASAPGTAGGPSRFALPMMLPAAPFQWRVTNSSGAAANFTAYTVADYIR